MRKLTVTLFMFLCCIAAHAQDYCTTSRFDTTDVFTVTQVDIDTVVYGYNIDWQGNGDSLELEVLYPRNSIDPLAVRPMIMLIHGGGFVNGSLISARGQASYFAQKGFVALTINYRLGREEECVPNNRTSMIEAVYRANQDARAAMRYMVVNAATYKIDTSRIMLYGRSAGAITALLMHFANEADFEALLPGITNSLGGLNSSTNSLRGRFSIKGIGGLSGALFDSLMITSRNKIPLEMFHGTDDSVVPYKTGFAQTCQYGLPLAGSYTLAQRLKRLDGCYELCYQPDAGHTDLYDGDNWFVEKRLSHFFKRVLCDDCRQTVYRDLTLISDQSLSLIASAGEEEAEHSPLALYPNPCHGLVTISGIEARNVTLVNSLGEVVTTFDGAVTAVDMSRYPQGLYMVVVTDASGRTLTRRLMKLDGE